MPNVNEITTSYCKEYYHLLTRYVNENAERANHHPNQAQLAFDVLANHRRTCPTCRAHMRAMTAFAEQAHQPHTEEYTQ